MLVIQNVKLCLFKIYKLRKTLLICFIIFVGVLYRYVTFSVAGVQIHNQWDIFHNVFIHIFCTFAFNEILSIFRAMCVLVYPEMAYGL